MGRCYIWKASPQAASGASCSARRSPVAHSRRALGVRPRDVQARNEVERLFRRLKGYRRIFSRFDKPDVMFIAFIGFALIADGLRLC
jgi:hypothetical protein